MTSQQKHQEVLQLQPTLLAVAVCSMGDTVISIVLVSCSRC